MLDSDTVCLGLQKGDVYKNNCCFRCSPRHIHRLVGYQSCSARAEELWTDRTVTSSIIDILGQTPYTTVEDTTERKTCNTHTTHTSNRGELASSILPIRRSIKATKYIDATRSVCMHCIASPVAEHTAQPPQLQATHIRTRSTSSAHARPRRGRCLHSHCMHQQPKKHTKPCTP